MDILLKCKNDEKHIKNLGFIVALESKYVRVYIFSDTKNETPIGYIDIIKADYDDFCLDILNTNRRIFKKDNQINNDKRNINKKTKCRNSG